MRSLLLLTAFMVPVAHAYKPFMPHRPTVVLRTTGQFITESAENIATLYDINGNPIRSFVVPERINRLEVSADDSIIRIKTVDHDMCFRVRSGEPVADGQFVTAVEPDNARFVAGEFEDVKNHRPGRQLEVVEISTKRRVRLVEDVGRVYPPLWSSTGLADIRVVFYADGREEGGAFRFDPSTGELRELFRIPVGYQVIEKLAFDTELGYGVVTWPNLRTSVIDLRTGKEKFEIDNSANFIYPSTPWYVILDQQPRWVLMAVLAFVAFIFGLCGFFLVRFSRRRYRRIMAGSNRQESTDYKEPRKG
ncbi:hypothetical protein [Zavarzinella formosa]|uniref:hypothetical protein n=1 Tax=Zavarzinella formosa TaxID=360055 RepID=UPI00037C4A84|nr:hypothetical protein [Zavarzinella formosa]